MLTTLALRFGVLALGLVFGAMAVHSWLAGRPPAWSFAGPRTTTEVLETSVHSERIGRGSLRHHAVVQVAWPPSSQPLASLHTRFSAYRQAEAAALVAAYTPGQRIVVRVVDGLPHADHHDRFQLLHAVAMSLLSLFATALGALLFVAGRPPAAGPREVRTP